MGVVFSRWVLSLQNGNSQISQAFSTIMIISNVTQVMMESSVITAPALIEWLIDWSPLTLSKSLLTSCPLSNTLKCHIQSCIADLCPQSSWLASVSSLAKHPFHYCSLLPAVALDAAKLLHFPRRDGFLTSQISAGRSIFHPLILEQWWRTSPCWETTWILL